MRHGLTLGRLASWFVCALVVVGLTGIAVAAPPVVKTVPWVATNPLIPHDTYAGKSITLKGTADVEGPAITYTWDFGDGTAVATGTVADMHAIQATHVYTGSPGTIYTARLTVLNTGTGESASKEYFVAFRDKSLEIEVNIAIDEGLWALHKAQRRYNTSGVDLGDWATWNGYYGLQAANINAFEANGHLESGDPSNPYVETVARAMRRLFQLVAVYATPVEPLGNPDGNGNGFGIAFNQSYQGYQTGMLLDAIVASGTPNAVTTTGVANVISRKYMDIAQDIADYIFYMQYDDLRYGGWRYEAEQFPDNSACQWDAIGLIAAERVWGITIPQWVKDANKNWLIYSQSPTTGTFGYQNTGAGWGYLALTASGLVQMVMDDLGRASTSPNWANAESYLRNTWDGPVSYGPMKTNFLYALFSFTKAMRLHNPPIVMLKSTTPATYPDLDWYGAELSKGAPSDGIARALVNQQHADGSWLGSPPAYPDGNHSAFQTAWAIIMLNRTTGIESGVPVAVAKATPNPSLAGEVITLDGSASFHQDPAKSIISWQWDLNNDGTFDVSGPVVTTSFPALGTYPVTLKVCDNATPPACADTIVTVLVTIPPVAPTANAGGPYLFCPNRTPWYLDGTKSVNPDDGKSQPGAPGDFITAYLWDLNGDGVFGDVTGAQPDVTGFYAAKGPGGYIAQLKVADNTALSFPSSGLPNLTSTASAQVLVKAADDPACAGCISNLTARAKPSEVQLVWTQTGAHHYNVYRSTISGGPYLFIGSTTSTYSTYLDRTVSNGTTYYYVVRPALLNGAETCQSNQASARPVSR